MSDISSLTAAARERAGKGAARALRRSERVPAVIYGDKKDPLPISISMYDLHKELQQPGFFGRLYDVSIDGSKHRVLPRDVQRHPVTDSPLHVDFLRIGAGASVTVAVAVVFINEEECPGLKRGGVLNIVRHDIEMVCPATAIPDSIDLDLSGLEIGDSVHISSLSLPPDCEPTISDRDFTIVTIASPTVVQEEAEAAEGEEDIEGEIPAEGEEDAATGEDGAAGSGDDDK